MCIAERLIHNVTMLTADPARAGDRLRFGCTFRYVFSGLQVQVHRFVWYLNDLRLTPSRYGRITVDVVDPDLTGTWISTLTFDPAYAKDSGRCASR